MSNRRALFVTGAAARRRRRKLGKLEVSSVGLGVQNMSQYEATVRIGPR